MILNRQRKVRVAQRPLQLFLRRLQEHLGLGTADVSICLVSDAEIARMNEVFRKKKGPTDVLSFPAVARRKPVRQRRPSRVVGTANGRAAAGVKPDAPGSEYLGDVAISPATARRNAKEFGRTLPNELQILILHGVLHLLGYDHETDRGQMHRFEQQLRRRLGLA
jgi:probable rRNA maturation factor